MKKKPNSKSVAMRSRSDEREVDFSKYRIRRNRYAKRVATEGIHLVHEAPSQASLRDIPEADFAKVHVRRSPYAQRIEASGLKMQVSRGRPPRGREPGPTVLKSVRLPPSIWAKLERRARSEGVAVHALVRQAILDLLARGA